MRGMRDTPRAVVVVLAAAAVVLLALMVPTVPPVLPMLHVPPTVVLVALE